jgi:hypothetical protein
MSPAALLRERERMDGWARSFVERWYRGQGNLADDFRRFAREHGVPPEADACVRERAQELLLAPLVDRPAA